MRFLMSTFFPPYCLLITLGIFEHFTRATGIWNNLWVICLSKAREPSLLIFYVSVPALCSFLPKILLNRCFLWSHWSYVSEQQCSLRHIAVNSPFTLFSLLSELLVLKHFWHIGIWWTLGWFFCYCCSDIILDFIYQGCIVYQGCPTRRLVPAHQCVLFGPWSKVKPHRKLA